MQNLYCEIQAEPTKTFCEIKQTFEIKEQADEIVITTGWDGYDYLKDTEFVKIDFNGNIIATPTSCKLPNYPLTLSGAKGIVLSESNVNMICGGGKYYDKTAT